MELSLLLREYVLRNIFLRCLVEMLLLLLLLNAPRIFSKFSMIYLQNHQVMNVMKGLLFMSTLVASYFSTENRISTTIYNGPHCPQHRHNNKAWSGLKCQVRTQSTAGGWICQLFVLYMKFIISQDFFTTSRIFIKEVKGIKSAILEYF